MALKRFPILYKYTEKGQIQQWQIVVEYGKFHTIEGIQGGKLTTSLSTFCTGKNIGKSNQTTDDEQALAEAAAKHQKKLDKGYNEVLTDKKNFFEPMLAHELNKYEKLLFTVPTFIQPKLDGLRCISENNSLMSRNGKPYLACPHLYQSDVTLDGELYSHEYHDDFNKIVSLCKKQKPTQEELEESKEKVEFWAYDYPSFKGKFSKRYEQLKFKVALLDNKSIRIVPTFRVKNQAEIEKYHEKFLGDGFEGSIIRLDLGDYENKRSKQLLKKKDFVDEEFKIIGAEEGEGGRAGTIGFFIIQHDKVKDKTFKSNVKGDFDFLRDVWKDRKKYIGTKATIKYFNRTPDDVPRFPYIIKLNREEYE
jgi:ATP-dependent DNA ligase